MQVIASWVKYRGAIWNLELSKRKQKLLTRSTLAWGSVLKRLVTSGRAPPRVHLSSVCHDSSSRCHFPLSSHHCSVSAVSWHLFSTPSLSWHHSVSAGSWHLFSTSSLLWHRLSPSYLSLSAALLSVVSFLTCSVVSRSWHPQPEGTCARMAWHLVKLSLSRTAHRPAWRAHTSGQVV